MIIYQLRRRYWKYEGEYDEYGHEQIDNIEVFAIPTRALEAKKELEKENTNITYEVILKELET